jgi:hypothetical protein
VTGSVEQVELATLIPGLFWPDGPWTVPTLRACLGREVEAVAYSEFWHDGEPDPALDGDLEFRFRDTHPLKVTITHMHGVTAAPYPIFPETLEADRMEWRRRELSVAAPWSSLIGSRLVSVRVLIKPDIGYGFRAGVNGFLFEFSNGGRVGYENRDESGLISFDPTGGAWSVWQVVEWMRFAPPSEG